MALAASAETRNDGPSGHFTGNIYISESLHFSYPLPDGYVADQELAAKPFAGGLARLLVVADQHTGRGFKNRLLLLADERKGYGKLKLENYVLKAMERMVETRAASSLPKPRRVLIKGHAFIRANYQDDSGPQALYKVFICTDHRGFFLTWVFVSTSQEDLAKLVASLHNVTFN